jgi:hypothetical protein
MWITIYQILQIHFGSNFFISGICSKIVCIEPYQKVVLDLKSVLDVIYTMYASWRIGNVESKVSKWRDQMLQQTNGNLRSYITFKSNFGREKYLSVLKRFEQRRCLTQLRISCHQWYSPIREKMWALLLKMFS